MERFNAETQEYRTRSVHDLLSLKGKTVVITGGARGLGLAWARGCAEVGADVAVIDRLSAPDPEFELLNSELGVKARFYHGDVSDYEGLEACFAQIVKDFSKIDALVAGAGVGGLGELVSQSKEKIQKTVDVNVVGTITTCQLAVRQMITQKTGGSIVTVASIGGHKGIAGQSNAVYCASKGAVLSFTKSFAVEVAKHGIRVNSVSPGYFLTSMTPGYVAKDLKLLEQFEALPPLKRIADRAELKSLVPFLLSDASSYITGTDILVDGGILA